MAYNALIRVAKDAYVNFYEVAAVVPDHESDGVRIMMKNGNDVVVYDTTVKEVSQRIIDGVTAVRDPDYIRGRVGRDTMDTYD